MSERPVIAPRLITKAQAADYLGLSTRGLDEWIRAGRVPGPIPGTHRWDKRAIDAALDTLSLIAPAQQPSAIEEWRASRARASQGDQHRPVQAR